MRKNTENLASYLRQKRLARLNHRAIDFEMVIPEEPLIYSYKFKIGERHNFLNFFRDKAWKSILRCNFRACMSNHMPVVLLVKFFVPPPEWVKVTKEALKAEKTPAVYSWEICDYLLSFLEMLHLCLFDSYKQIVKIDVMKFYSDKPRTEFKFMKWAHYDELYLKNSYDPKGKSKRNSKETRESVQPERKGDATSEGNRNETTSESPSLERSADSSMPLPTTRPSLRLKHKKAAARPLSTLSSPRRGQP